MRGKEHLSRLSVKSSRITPAYAGKSYRRISACPVHRDHPRLCGEKSPLWYNNRRGEGSPPPMRGKADMGNKCRPYLGITPAYAGKRHCVSIYHTGNGDHPRLCGEKSHFVKCSRSFTGSPPPMRGKVTLKIENSSGERITPAYAGKRESVKRSSRATPDHPRLCGEKNSTTGNERRLVGSPPPMRGKVFERRHQSNNNRITPAYAGKSEQPF